MSSNNKLLLWTRPHDVPFPSVWIEFEAKESRDSEKIVKYRVQDLPEDRFDDAVQHMKDNYLVDAPLPVGCGITSNAESLLDCIRTWRIVLEQKMTLVCFREGSDEIVAMNLLMINTEDDTFTNAVVAQSKSTIFVDYLKITETGYRTFSLYRKYNVDKYMGSLGLSVGRKYRGLGLSTRVLKARARLAAPFNIKITNSMFSSDISNISADKVGFQTDLSFTYDELTKNNPNFRTENVLDERVTVKTWVF